MRIARLFPVFLLFLSLIGCGSVQKSLDPYYGEMPCQRKAGEITCSSVESVYERATRPNYGDEHFSYPEEPFREGKKRHWKGAMLGMVGGAAVGAGIGALTVDDEEELKERTLPGGGKFYEVVKKDGDKLTSALVGAAIGAGAGAVFGYIVERIMEAHGTVDSALLKSVHERAKKYEKCIRDAARLEKKKGPEEAAKAAKKCGSILAGIPGIGILDSENISTLVKLQQEERKRVKKEISSFLLKKDVTPLRTPPTIVRVLITPWVDEKDVFHQGEVVYPVVDQGTWVLPSPQNVNESRKIDPLGGY